MWAPPTPAKGRKALGTHWRSGVDMTFSLGAGVCRAKGKERVPRAFGPWRVRAEPANGRGCRLDAKGRGAWAPAGRDQQQRATPPP